MQSNLPKVSIIIPYNRDRGYLSCAIKSIMEQNYEGEYEIIPSHSNNTVGYNLNRGIEKAKGDYVKYLCDDDMLTPWSISESVRAMEGNDFIHGKAVSFNDNGNESIWIPPNPIPALEEMLEKNTIHGGTLMYRRDVFDRVGYFDESLDCAEEYEFNLRCLSKDMKLGYCDNFLYLYRRHENQKSLGNSSEEYQAIRQEKIQKIRDRFL